MGKIAELTITKGRTVKAEDREEWIRLEYSIKAVVEEDSEIQVAKAHIDGLIDGWLQTALGSAGLVGAKQEQPGKAEAVGKASREILKPTNIFPKELADLLIFEETSDAIVIKPKQFLGSENFSKVAAIVKDYKGEYVSAGKESHFRIPKTSVK